MYDSVYNQNLASILSLESPAIFPILFNSNTLLFPWFRTLTKSWLHDTSLAYIKSGFVSSGSTFSYAVPYQLHWPVAAATRHVSSMQIQGGIRMARKQGERVRRVRHGLIVNLNVTYFVYACMPYVSSYHLYNGRKKLCVCVRMYITCRLIWFLP